jgi:Uma2 family endonuclease
MKASPTESYTADHLLDLPYAPYRTDLVAGHLIREPLAGYQHGLVAGRLFAALAAHAGRHRLGRVFAAETGFLLRRNPDTVRGPDVAFVTEERFVAQPPEHAFFDGAPDLAVEVLSPGNRRGEVEAKVLDYLRCGSRQVWVVRQRQRSVTVHRPRAVPRILRDGDRLSGGRLLPGFELPVASLFADL